MNEEILVEALDAINIALTTQRKTMEHLLATIELQDKKIQSLKGLVDRSINTLDVSTRVQATQNETIGKMIEKIKLLEQKSNLSFAPSLN